jgi:hypothetical protein
MLPYKIRKPVYSGASKHFLPNKPTGNRTDGDVGTTTAAAGSADGDQLEQLARDDPRLIGGNLQKAILLDLIDLRERFLERENVSTSNIVVDTVSASSSRTHHAIPSLGALFGQFKTTFKERRFGAIHTRTAPRNIDRGEYAQLIYSCCFYLLEGAVDHDQVDVQTNKFNLPKAIFAVFALYTLHETNPLPIAPLKPRQFTPRTKYGNFDEDALKEAWTVLPISREEQNLYRKCYKSPVRIDRRNYLLLLQLSDICKAIVAQCCCVDTNESSNNTRKCQCFLAQDASYIIDKMIFSENFFSYCEYHGPCGLEGLAGNPHFYKEHFAKQKKRKSKNGTSTGLPASLQLTQDKLDKMKNDDHLTTILNVSALCNVIDKHKSNLQNVTAQLQTSRQPGGDLQPKQRDVVENTLRGVINSQQAYFGMAAELNGEHAAGASRAGNISVAASVPGAKESDRNDVLPLVFPESFSSELRGNICEALADIGNEVTLIRSTVIEEMRARNTVQDSVVIDTKGEKSGQSLGDILAFFDVQQEPSGALEMNDEMDTEDEMSMATGAGKNALETLLKMAEEKIDSVQLDDDSVSSYDPKDVGDAMDDNSVATGSGMKALQNLLSQTTGGSTKQPTKRSTKPAKMKAKSPSGGQKCQKTKRVTKKLEQEDEISVATGAGKNALSSLLKLVDENIESEDDSMSYYDSKGEGEAILDDNSVATGSGMKALQNLLSQTTGSSPKQPCKRKKSPTKPGKSKAVPAASRRKRQKTKRDTKQALQRDTDDEVSVDASTATGLSGKDDVSVASTTAAGKDALAALLSQVQSVEQI